MSFGFSAFSQVPVSDDGFTRTDPYGGGVVVIHFNKDILKFPLQINKEADFTFNISKQADFSLDINKILDFTTRR
jgi:hypothetical protein